MIYISFRISFCRALWFILVVVLFLFIKQRTKKKKNKENIEKLFQCAISVFYLLRPNSITTTKQLIQIIFPMRMSAHRYSNRTNGNVRATLCVQLCVTSRSVCKNKVRIVLHCGEWCSCFVDFVCFLILTVHDGAASATLNFETHRRTLQFKFWKQRWQRLITFTMWVIGGHATLASD